MVQMIDMAQVFAGFINHHPGKAKGRQEDYHSYPQPWDFHNDLVCERLAPWAGQIYTIQRSQPSQTFIFDHYLLDVSTQWGQYIGLHCTVPKNNKRTRWEPNIPVVAKCIDIDNWQNEGPWIRGPIPPQDPCGIERKKAYIGSPCQYDKEVTCMGWGNDIFDVNVYDFGGSVGSRWYIVLGTAPPIGPDIWEYYAWDLGPEPGVFAPEWGWLAYKHIHAGGDWEVETYANLMDFSITESECDHIII